MPGDARDRILDSAEARLLSGGPGGLVLDAIAADAGVSKGGLLYHFPSKEALVAGLCARMLERFDDSLGRFRDRQPARPEAPSRAGPARPARATGERGVFARAYLASTVTGEGKPADSSAQLMAGLLATLGRDSAHLEAVRTRFLAWHEAFSDDGLDETTATIVRLAVDGLWLSALLGLPQLAPGPGRRVVEALRQMTREPGR